ncbi:putative acetyltransferase [Burkholderia sp. ABCPW 111]|nr:putative acetyltransferase [Burkholderia sp. ABCPW 111]
MDYPGVSLRQLERTDADAWYAYLKLPHVVEHTSWNLRAKNDLLPLFDGYDATSAESTRRLATRRRSHAGIDRHDRLSLDFGSDPDCRDRL